MLITIAGILNDELKTFGYSNVEILMFNCFLFIYFVVFVCCCQLLFFVLLPDSEDL